jgi:hypothetical protein
MSENPSLKRVSDTNNLKSLLALQETLLGWPGCRLGTIGHSKVMQRRLTAKHIQVL